MNPWRASAARGGHVSTQPHGARSQVNALAGSGGRDDGEVIWVGMRIVGLGLDATEVPRIAAMLDEYGDRFRQRVYTPGEIAYCDRKVKHAAAASYAARFAAKEAGMKAIGTGKSQGVLWRDVEVVRGRFGPPQLAFHGAAKRHFERLGATGALITITHTNDLAIAHVMLIAE